MLTFGALVASLLVVLLSGLTPPAHAIGEGGYITGLVMTAAGGKPVPAIVAIPLDGRAVALLKAGRGHLVAQARLTGASGLVLLRTVRLKLKP